MIYGPYPVALPLRNLYSPVGTCFPLKTFWRVRMDASLDFALDNESTMQSTQTPNCYNLELGFLPALIIILVLY